MKEVEREHVGERERHVVRSRLTQVPEVSLTPWPSPLFSCSHFAAVHETFMTLSRVPPSALQGRPGSAEGASERLRAPAPVTSQAKGGAGAASPSSVKAKLCLPEGFMRDVCVLATHVHTQFATFIQRTTSEQHGTSGHHASTLLELAPFAGGPILHKPVVPAGILELGTVGSEAFNRLLGAVAVSKRRNRGGAAVDAVAHLVSSALCW